MGDFVGYVFAAIGFGVWMILFAVISQVNETIVPMIREVDSTGMFSAPVSWLLQIEGNWVLIGLVGLLASLLARGLATRVTGV